MVKEMVRRVSAVVAVISGKPEEEAWAPCELFVVWGISRKGAGVLPWPAFTLDPVWDTHFFGCWCPEWLGPEFLEGWSCCRLVPSLLCPRAS